MTYYHKYNIYTGKEFDNDLTLSENANIQEANCDNL